MTTRVGRWYDIDIGTAHLRVAGGFLCHDQLFAGCAHSRNAITFPSDAFGATAAYSLRLIVTFMPIVSGGKFLRLVATVFRLMRTAPRNRVLVANGVAA